MSTTLHELISVETPKNCSCIEQSDSPPLTEKPNDDYCFDDDFEDCDNGDNQDYKDEFDEDVGLIWFTSTYVLADI